MPTMNDERLPESFWRRVELDKRTGCWLWTGRLTAPGYADFSQRRIPRLGHRAAYGALVGPIPDGLVLDHLCRVRHCVNPGHLEPVTRRENSLRGISPSVIAYKTNTCFKGHSMEDAYVWPRTGERRCRVCMAEATRRLHDDPEFRKHRAAAARERYWRKKASADESSKPERQEEVSA